MDRTTTAIILTVFLGLVGVAGDFCIKLASDSQKSTMIKWFVLGSGIWAATAFGWFYVYKHIKLSTSAVFYAITTVLFLTFVSVFYFKEKLNMFELIGITMAILSLILLKKFM